MAGGCTGRMPSVNRRLILPKVTYLLVWSCMASLIPFLSVYLKTKNLTPFEVGVILSVKPFTVFAGTTVLSTLADRYDAHKIILITTFVTSSAIRMLIMWVESFWALFLVVLAAELIGSAYIALIDGGVLAVLWPDTALYGKQRLYGAVGWGAMALVAGAIAEAAQNDNTFFYIHMLLTFVSLVPLSLQSWKGRSREEESLPTPSASGELNIEGQAQPTSSSGSSFSRFINFLRPMMRVLIQPAVATFFITVFSLGALMCLVNVYLFVYLADMGGTSTLFGLSLAVTCIAEIPFFFFSERLLKRFSPSAVILFSICVYSLRFIYYSFITNPWAVLPAELLHGITYAACWAAQTEFVSQISPAGMGTSMQGLLTATMWGLGLGCGTLVFGLVYDEFGPVGLYRTGAGWSAVTGLFFYFTRPTSMLESPLREQARRQQEQRLLESELSSSALDNDTDFSSFGVAADGEEGIEMVSHHYS